MANLKAGTLIGGNMIWNHGNLPVNLSNNTLYLKTYKVYTEADKPTPAEVGAVNKVGDTMTGNLSMSGTTKINFTALNTGTYIHSGKGDGATQSATNLQIRTWQGFGISPTAGNDALVPDAKNSIWMNARNGNIYTIGDLYAATDKRVYHQGFKPTYGDVGAAPDGYGLGATQCARVPNKKLDDAVNAGFYAIYGEDAGGPLNDGLGPSGSRMLVVSWSSVHVTQMFWPINSTDVYVRYKGTNAGDTNWSGWQRIYTTRNPPTATEVKALPISGGTMTGAITIGSQVIKGQFDKTLLRDHGNGNVTLSASVNSSDVAGDLYLGYNSGTTNLTRNLRVEVPMNWKGSTTIVNDSGINSEFLQGPIRTEKDSANIWHTIIGGTDTVNRGRTIVAAGECGKQIADNTTTGDEVLHLAADAAAGIWLHTGVQAGWGTSGHKKVKIHDGEIYAIDGTKKVFRQGWDFGLGNRQGAGALANEYTEGKTYDFNDLITAGEFGISGNWANGINNVPEASGHTGMVKVEVRNWSAGPAYVQTFTYSGGEHVARATRYGTGTYPNITWKRWIRFGPYEVQSEYRMTINRSGENVYPYMSIVKADKRTELTSGYYIAGALQFKESPTDANNPDSGRPLFVVRADTTWNQGLNRAILQLRKASDNNTAAEIVMYEDNVRLIVNGKASEFKESSANLPGTLQIVGKLNNGAFTSSNKQLMNANSSDYVYVGNPTVTRMYLETDANALAYVNAAGSAKRIYHEGFKPTAADVGAIPTTGTAQVQATLATRTINSADVTAMRDYSFAGFYRTNGHTEDGIALPSLMIHCPHSSGKAHGRGLGFNYAGWGVWTTSWNSSGVFQGMKKVYTEVDKPTPAEIGLGNVPNTVHTTAATANTVVVRDSSADVVGRLFRSTYADESSMSGAIAFRKSTTDNYTRFCSNPNSVRAWLAAQGTADIRSNSMNNTQTTIPATESGDMNAQIAGYYGLYNGSKVANSPYNSYFYCETKSIYANGALLQTAWPYDGFGGVFHRNYSLNSKSWSPWRELPSSGISRFTGAGNGNDYHQGGIEVVGNGSADTIKPVIGFHQPALYASSIALWAAGDFRFHTQGASAYANILCQNVNANDVYIRSDIRLKTNLVKVENALEKVASLTAYSYDKKQTLKSTEYDKHEVGLIAQDVEKVLPEAISRIVDSNNEDGDEVLTISNSAVNALLVEAIKELNKRIEYLESKIKE